MKNYYMGLDMGTESIGWAVTDEQYNVPKFRGNAMWGVRLLDGGETADERRTFRGSRRRADRNKFRQQCLEMLFDKEIAKKDVAFFQRLKDSSFYDGDKNVEGKFSIFNDKDYTDIQYHKSYPTIYHLRKHLVENSQPHDVRLVYLALSHIIKNRGHFLFDSESIASGQNSEFRVVWNELNVYLQDNYESELYCENISEIENILKNSTFTITKKKESLSKLFNLNRKENQFEMQVVALLSGGSADTNKLFDCEEYKDSEVKSITFKSGFDEKVSMYESVLAEKFELVEKLKAVYDWAVLADILKGESYISFAKVKDYQKHGDDLKLLKEYVRAYASDKYKLIFNKNDSKVCNYLSYSAHNKKGVIEKKCNQEEFCEFLKKQLPKEPCQEKYQKMYDEIAAFSFMPKAVTKDNSVIPMQTNKAELSAILKNAKGYLSFLNEKDESGKTVGDKIMDIFKFRVPYYVGPLNTHSEKSWLVRSSEKIYPWNFEQVVDIDKSAENFINNLTSKCTYLNKEDVIPKNSLLYSSYMVLNELNKVKINEEPISLSLKQSIYTDLFEKRNKVTNAGLKKYLASMGHKNAQITGVDGDFKGSLKSFRELEFVNLPNEDKEEIIRAITVFGDDKKLLKNRLKNQYGNEISDEDIKKICKLKYAGWSRLSKKLLTGIESVIPETGEVTNIIHALWETNENLMQLLSDNYDFMKNIEVENGTQEIASLKNNVDNLYVSPKIKRHIHQTMQIVREISKIQGGAPKKIFLEVARFDGVKGDKGRKKSRKQALLELYKNCSKEDKALFEQLKNTDENQFKRDALYLYYTQLGKCMYTGKTIPITDIYNKNIYDIDHIFPQSKIKDDSLDNRVLVLKTVNEDKGNIYPIKTEIREKQVAYWEMLFAKKLISAKKFSRLKRNTPLTDDELSAFINRQLVETQQSTKAVAELLKKYYPDTKIEYIKAGLVSDFRHNYHMLKCREVNDLHHAKDAFLNIVVGNVYTTKAHQTYFINELQQGKCSMNRMFDYPVKGAWESADSKSLKEVKKTMEKNNIRFTRYATKKLGGLFDQNPVKKGNGQVSLKKNSPLSDIEKYGGYNRPASTYFAFVEYLDKKGKSVRSFEPVDLYIEKEYLENPQAFMAKRLGVDDVKILVLCVKYNALISLDGFRMHISSKSNGGAKLVCKPAMQLVLGQKLEEYVKKISVYLERCRVQKEPVTSSIINSEDNIKLYDMLVHKCCYTIFSVKFKKTGKTLADKKEFFKNLNNYEQSFVLMQVLNILHCNVVSGDLSLLGEPKQSGITTISNKLQPGYSSFKLINQSITGLYEQEIDLLN